MVGRGGKLDGAVGVGSHQHAEAMPARPRVQPLSAPCQLSSASTRGCPCLPFAHADRQTSPPRSRARTQQVAFRHSLCCTSAVRPTARSARAPVSDPPQRKHVVIASPWSSHTEVATLSVRPRALCAPCERTQPVTHRSSRCACPHSQEEIQDSFTWPPSRCGGG